MGSDVDEMLKTQPDSLEMCLECESPWYAPGFNLPSFLASQGGGSTTVPLADRPFESGFVSLSYAMCGCRLNDLCFSELQRMFQSLPV